VAGERTTHQHHCLPALCKETPLVIALQAHARPVVMVIGADRPLAARVCEELAGAHHYTVIATAADARRIPQRLRTHRVERVRLDVTDEAQLRRFFIEHANAYQRLDAVVYCPDPVDAPEGLLGLPHQLPALLAANLIAPWACLAHAVQWLTEFGGRSLVLATIDCSRLRRQAPGLQTSQAALARYAELLAAELADTADGQAPIGFTTVPVDPWREKEPDGLEHLATQFVQAVLRPQQAGVRHPAP
jgi:NAD(P)-dependent dehydrogenase (short-subunit alcohol dehydrogenase family)